MWDVFQEVFFRYFGGTFICPVLLIMAFGLSVRAFRSEAARGFGELGIFLVLLVWNPWAMQLWFRVIQYHLYWRTFWLLPVGMILAFLTAEYAGTGPRIMKWIVPTAAVACICAVGTNVYTNGNFEKAPNPFKIPQTALETAEYIVTEEGEKEVEVLVPAILYLYLRQYNSNIHQLYGRDIEGFTSPVTDKKIIELYEYMQADVLDGTYIFPAARDFGCTYVILEAGKPLTGDPREYGYEEKNRIGEWVLYKMNDTGTVP